MKNFTTAYREGLYRLYFDEDGELTPEAVPNDLKHVERELILASICDMLTDDMKKARRIAAVLGGAAVTAVAAAAAIFVRYGYGE